MARLNRAWYNTLEIVKNNTKSIPTQPKTGETDGAIRSDKLTKQIL